MDGAALADAAPRASAAATTTGALSARVSRPNQLQTIRSIGFPIRHCSKRTPPGHLAVRSPADQTRRE
jgi:hypothetical protein